MYPQLDTRKHYESSLYRVALENFLMGTCLSCDLLKQCWKFTNCVTTYDHIKVPDLLKTQSCFNRRNQTGLQILKHLSIFGLTGSNLSQYNNRITD